MPSTIYCRVMLCRNTFCCGMATLRAISLASSCKAADSAEAIDQLERARQGGAEYLLFPQTSLWWLDHYDEFAEHLRERYSEVTGDDDCLVFALDHSEGGS